MWDSKKIVYGVILVGVFLLIYSNCQTSTKNHQDTFLNLSDTVTYVGMEQCKTCHYNVYETYIHTGMGRSFDLATPRKSAATYGDHALVYHEEADLYYRPFFRDSSLYIKEYRLDGSDTIFQRTEKVSYIVGSGQHTNSHILDINGYIFQAPITYYTQEEKWDMAPGFRGSDLRFSRLLTEECITCHNHFPKQVEGALNKYTEMPRGIECERCHGPGGLHLQEKMAGNIIDTSRFTDYTIVNPRRLERELQMDLCQRCHLQGVAVLNEGSSFFDFKPGMKLSEVLNVFLPRYTDSHEKFIMASQADRLRQSACYKASQMSCITCHNPHRSIEQTDQSQYNNACRSCHGGAKDQCSADISLRPAGEDNCVKCHMPRSGSIDIPHVNITDHWISKEHTVSTKRLTEQEKTDIQRFLGLQILTKEQALPLEMAKGYLALYDKYVDADQMLDSAKYYLDLSEEPSQEKQKTLVHYYFTRKDYTALQRLATDLPVESLNDAWTAYRLGEALYKKQQFTQALLYYKKATRLLPFHLDFQEKLGNTYLALRNLPQAMQTFEYILKENPKRALALNNLGYVKVLMGKKVEGEAYYDQALALDPDYELAIMNKVALRLQEGNKKAVRQLLNRVLKINPEHPQALELLTKI